MEYSHSNSLEILLYINVIPYILFGHFDCLIFLLILDCYFPAFFACLVLFVSVPNIVNITLPDVEYFCIYISSLEFCSGIQLIGYCFIISGLIF